MKADVLMSYLAALRNAEVVVRDSHGKDHRITKVDIPYGGPIRLHISKELKS